MDHIDHPDLVAAAEPWIGPAEILLRERLDVVDRSLGGHTHHTAADLDVGGRFRGVGDGYGYPRVARDVSGLLMRLNAVDQDVLAVGVDLCLGELGRAVGHRCSDVAGAGAAQ